MPTLDPYRTLLVHPEADAEIISAAYRKLAQRYHPDVAGSPDAAARMAELNAARDLLADPERRAAYDRAAARRDRSHGAEAAPAAGAASSRPTGGTSETATAARRAAAHAPSNAAPSDAAPAQPADAGPAPGRPSGTILHFGRYTGWSLAEIARADLEYIEWLDRMPIGRSHRAELDALLRQAGRRGIAAAEGRRGPFRGR